LLIYVTVNIKTVLL